MKNKNLIYIKNEKNLFQNKSTISNYQKEIKNGKIITHSGQGVGHLPRRPDGRRPQGQVAQRNSCGGQGRAGCSCRKAACLQSVAQCRLLCTRRLLKAVALARGALLRASRRLSKRRQQTSSMAEIFRVLREMNVQWKKLGPYNLKCLCKIAAAAASSAGVDVTVGGGDHEMDTGEGGGVSSAMHGGDINGAVRKEMQVKF